MDLAGFAGAREILWPGPGPLVVPDLALDPADYDALAVMQPGTIAMPGEPVAWWIDGPEIALDGCAAVDVHPPRQVYRRLDDAGRITGDLVAPIDAELPAGMPLLVPLRMAGEPIGEFTMEAEAWLAMQRAAMDGETVPVEGG